MRGGSFANDGSTLSARHRSVAAGGHPTTEAFTLGFRLAYFPEPAMLAPMAGGGLVLMRRLRDRRPELWTAGLMLLAVRRRSSFGHR